jgi:DNA primase
MRFPQQFLDEIKARLPVSEVVGRRVKLRKAGHEWRGLSPFNKEKTPSFFANDQKMAWFDFSSGKNGSIFDFVMLTEGVSFPEAVERLAQQAGMPLPKVSAEEETRQARRRTLHDVVEVAARFFEASLCGRAGGKARAYLAERGIDAPTQVKFRLGYAPAERFALKEHLGKEGIAVEDMVEAGLLVAGEDIPVPYDRFRDRIMFPIADLRARVIAFGGRALEKDAPAKYLNSPETPLFHKGATLYNAAAARLAAHKGAPVIAVEGYVDAIAMAAAGYEATVAPLGTALTAEQLLLLWTLADEPTLCFDGDAAGRRASLRAVDLALPLLKPGKSLKFAFLPEGCDPDDLVRSGGRDAVAEVLGAARPLAEVLWMRESERSLDTPERRAALEKRVDEVTATIADSAVRKYYRREFRERLFALWGGFGAHMGGQTGAQMGAQKFRQSGRVAASPRGDREGRRLPPSYLSPRAGRAGVGPGLGGGGERRRPAGAVSRDAPYVVASAQLVSSPLLRGHGAAVPRREALILQAVLNHPWLAHDHLEELAGLEFRHADAQRLKSVLLDILAHGLEANGLEANGLEANGLEADPQKLRAALLDHGHESLLARIEKAITTPDVWGAGPQAAGDDVLMTWKQLVALHRQSHSLIKELHNAEQALGRDTTEANYSWLQDVKARLSATEGIEALIEGFGTSSGRGAPSW